MLVPVRGFTMDSSSKMSELQSLEVFFIERLTAAGAEIFAVVQKTVVEYRDKVSRLKEENERLQRTLHLVFKPDDVKLHKEDPQQFSLPASEEEVPPEQQQHHGQEWSSSLGQQNPETPQIKQEEQESITSQEEEQLQALQFDIKEFIFTPPSVNGDCDQEDSLQLSHLYQTGESRERASPPTNTTQQFKTEPEGEGYGLSQPTTTDSWPLFEVYRDQIERAEVGRSGELQSGGQKPYWCLTCNRCFQRQDLLKVHERTHTGQKPHQCKQCGKCFTRKVGLSGHMRTHTGERPFKCEACGKFYRSVGNLKAHQRIHTGVKPHQCQTCGKCFLLKKHLSYHMLIHTGEKPHQCKQCGKCFSRKEHLSRHTLIHTGENHATVTKNGTSGL